MFVGIILLLGQIGCGQQSNTNNSPPDPVVMPELTPGRTIKPGIHFQEATLVQDQISMKVWYYQPEEFTGWLPLVIVPPAGSKLFVGMGLAEGDRAEHYPYVNAGFAVVSFEIDGHVPNMERASDASLLTAARQFRDAQAGLENVRLTLDYILEKVPHIDRDRIYIAGHSSAGTLALLAAAHEPRIKACLAYAPATDVENHLAQALPTLEQSLPGFKKFIRFSSPKTHVNKLHCPVFLFHAKDDGNIPSSQTLSFASQLKKSNPNVTVDIVPAGGHYDSMIREGISKGIEWLKQLQEQFSGANK